MPHTSEHIGDDGGPFAAHAVEADWDSGFTDTLIGDQVESQVAGGSAIGARNGDVQDMLARLFAGLDGGLNGEHAWLFLRKAGGDAIDGVGQGSEDKRLPRSDIQLVHNIAKTIVVATS